TVRILCNYLHFVGATTYIFVLQLSVFLLYNKHSIVTYIGEQQLIDYTATKGAIVGFTRALAKNVAKQGIRVNAVAPGRIWTPLIPASFSSDEVAVYGADNPMQRVAQPFELAPAYVYLASDDSRFVTGQVLHVDGGGSTNS
ncbi:enoyl-ACP reductase-like protein, partial [Muricomes intestini]